MEQFCLAMKQHCPLLMPLSLQLLSSGCHHLTKAQSPVLGEQAVDSFSLGQSTDDY